MNLARARRPLTFSQKSPWGAVQLLSSSFCPTLPDLLCLPSAQVHYVHLFHRNNSLHINCSFSPLRSIHSLSFPSIHSLPEQSHRFIGRTWPYCVRMRGWEKGERWRVCSANRATLKSRERSWGQHGGQRTGVSGINMGPTLDHSVCCRTFGPFRQLIRRFKRTPCWFNTHQSSTVSWSSFDVTCHGKRSSLYANLTPITHPWANRNKFLTLHGGSCTLVYPSYVHFSLCFLSV